MAQAEPYPELLALMARLREDDPARIEYENLMCERDRLIHQVEQGTAVRRLLHAVTRIREEKWPAVEDRHGRTFRLLLTALSWDLTAGEEWPRVTDLLTACTSEPEVPLETLREIAGLTEAEEVWREPELAEVTLIEFKKRYPRHDADACVADFTDWFRRGLKTSKNPDAAFLTFAKRWTTS